MAEPGARAQVGDGEVAADDSDRHGEEGVGHLCADVVDVVGGAGRGGEHRRVGDGGAVVPEDRALHDGADGDDDHPRAIESIELGSAAALTELRPGLELARVQFAQQAMNPPMTGWEEASVFPLSSLPTSKKTLPKISNSSMLTIKLTQ